MQRRYTWQQEQTKREGIIDQQLQENATPWLTKEALTNLLTNGRTGNWREDERPVTTLEQALTILCGQGKSAIYFHAHKEEIVLMNTLAESTYPSGGAFYTVPPWLLTLYHEAQQLVVVLPERLPLGQQKEIKGKTYIVESCYPISEQDAANDEEVFDTFNTAPGWYSRLRLKQEPSEETHT